MKKFNILLLSMLLLISFISAESYVLINECYNITTSCYNCSSVYIDTIKINNSIILINESMSNVGYSYYYGFCNTSFQGEYYVTLIKNFDDGNKTIINESFIVNEWGVGNNTFYIYVIFYIVLLFMSLLFVYKYATFDGKGIKNSYMFLWASFFNLIIFVIMTVYPSFNNLLIEIIRMLFFGFGAYFLIEGIVGVLAQSEQRH